MDDKYSTIGRYGMASAHSYLDGVPFKIGPNFRPPAQIDLPSELLGANVHSSSDEYNFETEEAVLTWAKAREDALKEAERQRQVEQAQRAAIQETPDSSDDGEEKEEENESTDPSVGLYDVPPNHHATVNGALGKPQVPPKPVIPKPLSEPNTILKPIPIQPAASSGATVQNDAPNGSQSQAPSTPFDVSMFEQETDPFDNLELQTLNDMEELKTLLEQPAKPCNGSGGSAPPRANKNVSSSSVSESKDISENEGIYDIASIVKDNNWVTFDNDEDKKEPTVTNGVLNDTLTFTAAVSEGEYVEIDKKYSHQPAEGQERVNGVHGQAVCETDSAQDKVMGGKLPASLANSKLYKPVLPPIPGAAKSQDLSNGPIVTSTNPFTQPYHNTFQPPVQTNPFSPGPRMTPIPAVGADTQVSPDPAQGTAPAYQSKVRALPTPPPIVKPSSAGRSGDSPRMWSSVGPSLAASLEDSSSTGPTAVLSNPYSRHSVSATDLHGEADRSSPVLNPITSSTAIPNAALMNRLRPLPPTPSPRQSVSTPPTPAPRSSQPAPEVLGLGDPYHSLSSEARAFTDSLSSMGFLRARVARAVHKFGQDEREVLDHLLAVDQLVEKKYAPVMAELALHTYKNDTVKSEKFLEMQSQFEELGFKSDSVREALMTTDMDHDKALDMLTA